MNYSSLPAFGKDQSIHIVIESPRGSSVKLKFDPDPEAFVLSRPLTEGVVFPYDWGFVPSTRGADGDPIDAVVVWDQPSFPGVVLSCRLIGVLGVEQNSKQHPGQRERNDRVIALPLEAPRYTDIKSVDDFSDRLKEELELFFRASTALEKKDIEFRGWSDADVAYAFVKASLDRSHTSSF